MPWRPTSARWPGAKRARGVLPAWLAAIFGALALGAACQGQGSGPGKGPALVPPPRPAPRRAASVLFRQHCATCHGPTGRGDGKAVHMLTTRPLDWSRPGALETLSDARLREWIARGTPATGHRPQPMPGFLGALAEGEIDALVGYVRGLAAEPPEPPKRRR